MAKYTPVQTYEGSWYRVKGYTHTECCDCALVHKEQYRLVNGHLEWKAEVDRETTDKRRKELGIKVTHAKNRNRRTSPRRAKRK